MGHAGRTGITEISAIVLALAYGFFVHTFHDVLAMGVLLGVAGASFGVALSLGSGWFPKEHKGLAMRIAGVGNSGTALAVLLGTSPGAALRMAKGLRLCRCRHASSLCRHDLLRQRTAGHRTPDPARTPLLPIGEGRLGLQPGGVIDFEKNPISW